MKRIHLPVMVILGILAVGQCLAQQPSFEVASVKVADPAEPPSAAWRTTRDPGRIHYGHVMMIQLLQDAFGAQVDQVLGGPAWIRDFVGSTNYVVDATMPRDSTKEQVRLMLQHLLAERFHLVIHHETRNFPGYELVVARDGHKMKEVTPDPEAVAAAAAAAGSAPVMWKRDKEGNFILPPGPQSMSTIGPGTYRERDQEMSMTDFAARLGHDIGVALDVTGNPGAPRPRVVDKTGLAGKYDFTLEYACAGCKGLGAMAASLPKLAAHAPADDPSTATASDPTGNSGLPTIFTAFEKQLGLKLVKVTDVPLDVVVIDRVDKVPTGN